MYDAYDNYDMLLKLYGNCKVFDAIVKAKVHRHEKQ